MTTPRSRKSRSPDAEARLRERAAEVGEDPARYAAAIIERSVGRPKALAEISGPLRDEFLASGMTDDKLGGLLDDVKHKMWTERPGETS